MFAKSSVTLQPRVFGLALALLAVPAAFVAAGPKSQGAAAKPACCAQRHAVKTAAVTDQHEHAAKAACCAKKAACCAENKPCCTAEVKPCCAEQKACCKPGAKCCAGEAHQEHAAVKAVNVAAQAGDCCAQGQACCAEKKACCGEHTVNTTAKWDRAAHSKNACCAKPAAK